MERTVTPATLVWANPTLARREGGWAWLAWTDDRGATCWAAASDELDAAISSARAGAPLHGLRATHGDDLVDALLEAGVLMVLGGDGPPSGPITSAEVAAARSTQRSAEVPAPGDPAPTVELPASGERAASAGSDVVPAPTTGARRASDLASAHAAFVGAFAREHGDVELPLLDVLEIPLGPGPLLAQVQIGPPEEPPALPMAPQPVVAGVVLPGTPPPEATSHVIALAPLAIAGAQPLPLDDLRVSIVGDRLALRSAALDRAVAPRLPRPPHDGDPGLVHLLAALGVGAAPRAFPDRRIAVAFPLGGEWLEVKLYASPRVVDAVLAELIAPFVAAAPVHDWHFLRYSDPRWHVRLRLRGEPRALVRDVLPALRDAAEPWLAEGRLRDFQIGTYRREVERYGGAAGVLAAERAFTADSACAAALCGLLAPDEDGDDARWRIVAIGIAQLVADLIPAGERAAVHEAMRDDFRSRIGRADVTGVRLTTDDLADARALLNARSVRIAPIAADLRAARPTRPLGEIAASLAHMFANRMFRAFALEQELAVYELLTAASRDDA